MEYLPCPCRSINITSPVAALVANLKTDGVQKEFVGVFNVTLHSSEENEASSTIAANCCRLLLWFVIGYGSASRAANFWKKSLGDMEPIEFIVRVRYNTAKLSLLS